jgi:osmotically-inducible protein OsmY
VPIVAKGKMVGIVSRANLIQALASSRKETEPSTMSDSMIRNKIMRHFNSAQWGKRAILNATVQDGKVKLWGTVESKAEKQAARVAAELVPAVRGVENNVIVQPAIARH